MESFIYLSSIPVGWRTYPDRSTQQWACRADESTYYSAASHSLLQVPSLSPRLEAVREDGTTQIVRFFWGWRLGQWCSNRFFWTERIKSLEDGPPTFSPRLNRPTFKTLYDYYISNSYSYAKRLANKKQGPQWIQQTEKKKTKQPKKKKQKQKRRVILRSRNQRLFCIILPFSVFFYLFLHFSSFFAEGFNRPAEELLSWVAYGPRAVALLKELEALEAAWGPSVYRVTIKITS